MAVAIMDQSERQGGRGSNRQIFKKKSREASEFKEK